MDIEEMITDDDDGLPLKHKLAKFIITGVGALLMKEVLGVYYDYVLTTRRELKEKEQE